MNIQNYSICCFLNNNWNVDRIYLSLYFCIICYCLYSSCYTCIVSESIIKEKKVL